MKTRTILLAAALGLSACGNPETSKAQEGVFAEQPRVAPGDASAMKASFAPVVRQAAPAVVNIAARGVQRVQSADPFFQLFGPQARVAQSVGSGVIVRPDGTVVTNYHVIEGMQQINVVLNDRREFPATVVLADARSDIAVLRLENVGERLPTLPIDDSEQQQVGDLGRFRGPRIADRHADAAVAHVRRRLHQFGGKALVKGVAFLLQNDGQVIFRHIRQQPLPDHVGRVIADALGRLGHLAGGFLAHLQAPVQHAVGGGKADARLARKVGNGRAAHRLSFRLVMGSVRALTVSHQRPARQGRQPPRRSTGWPVAIEATAASASRCASNPSRIPARGAGPPCSHAAKASISAR